MNAGAARITILILFLFLADACVVFAQEPMGDGGLDESARLAQKLCENSTGSLPNWAQYPSYALDLSEGEAEAVRYVAQILYDEVAPPFRPRYLAVSDYIAQYSRCDILSQSRDEETGRVIYRLNQLSPQVPPISEIAEGGSFEQRRAQYASLLASQGEPKLDAEEMRVVLQPRAEGGYELVSDVRHRFMYPLKMRRMQERLEAYDFSSAELLWRASCVLREPMCAWFAPYYHGAVGDVYASQVWFASAVRVSERRRTTVATTGGRVYTAIEMELENTGDFSFSPIIFRVRGEEGRMCEIQSRRDYGGGSALELGGRAVETGWCLLDGNLLPEAEVEIMMTQARRSCAERD